MAIVIAVSRNSWNSLFLRPCLGSAAASAPALAGAGVVVLSAEAVVAVAMVVLQWQRWWWWRWWLNGVRVAVMLNIKKNIPFKNIFHR
jgi:hypothetical protein